ncbi:MAG TPA: DUF790 family protein, partial [Polyangiaceae bacterium]|nr:DUF790 family protein [Polyangiaceae bacterium]
PQRARQALFEAARSRHAARSEVLAEVASALAVEPEALERSLFADLAGERLVGELSEHLSPSSLALESNFAIVSSLVRRAARVRIALWGNTRAVVRHARLRGLICSVEQGPDEAVRLELSGPFTLFRHTQVYGRALASLIPRLTWCERFELVAECPMRGVGAMLSFSVRTGDPIAAGRELAPFDSSLEERFAREFSKRTTDWDLVREPVPLEAGGTLIFPDFELVHRRHPERRFLLEIIGFWTADYLAQKLSKLRAAGITRLILCIDENRNCEDAELPLGACVIRFKRRIDPAAVLAIIEG